MLLSLPYALKAGDEQTWGDCRLRPFVLAAPTLASDTGGRDGKATVNAPWGENRFFGKLLMRATAIWGLFFLAALAVWAADKPESLDVRLGLWEVTTRTSVTSGEIPIPAGLLEKLTPEQRARLDDRMKAGPSETGKKTTSKYCLTKKRLNQGIPFDQRRKACTRTILSSSHIKIEIRSRCTDGDVHTDTIFHIERVGFENVKGDWQSIAGNSDRSFSSSFTARWVCSICSGIK